MENRDLKMAEKIAACVADKGGRTFLVGGYVRDLLMGKHSKDIDIEIHGVQPKELSLIHIFLSSFQYRIFQRELQTGGRLKNRP